MLIVSMLLMVLFVNAQWETKYFVDDFGDPTEESYKTFTVVGKFSNSATLNSECIFIFIDNGEYLKIEVYEYCNKKASFDRDLTNIKIKTPSGEVIEMPWILIDKNYIAFCNDKNNFIKVNLRYYTKILKILSEKGDFKMIFSDKALVVFPNLQGLPPYLAPGTNKDLSSYLINFTIE